MTPQGYTSGAPSGLDDEAEMETVIRDRDTCVRMCIPLQAQSLQGGLAGAQQACVVCLSTGALVLHCG